MFHLTQQRKGGEIPDADPLQMPPQIFDGIFGIKIRVMQLRGAIKDSFGGLLHTVQIPTVDVAGVA